MNSRTWQDLGQLKLLLAPQARFAILGGICLGLNSVLQLPFPLLTMYVVDKVIPEKRGQLLDWISLGLVVLLALVACLSFLEGYLLAAFRERSIAEIQQRLLQQIMNAPLACSQRFLPSGYLANRIRNDTNQLCGIMTSTVFNCLKDLLTFGVGTIALFSLHARLATASLALLVLFLASLKVFSRQLRCQSKNAQEKASQASGTLQETISHLPLIKAFLVEESCTSRFGRKLREFLQAELKLARLGFSSSTTNLFCASVAPVAILWYSGHQIVAGNLTLGKWIAFNSFLAYLFGPAHRLLDLNVSLQVALAALDRIRELCALPQEGRAPVVLRSRSWATEIELKEVSFSYDVRSPVLREVSLLLAAGQFTVLIGPSGSGKSTLVSLLLAFYQPQSGSILLDGKNYSDLDAREIRKRIGVVFQEGALFSGTIQENILLGDPEANTQKMVAAAKAANIHDFILELPHAYDTTVEEGGAAISGGQRQRITIARALLKDPDVLILDEATSQVDRETESGILEALLRLRQGRTTLIITHRLSSVDWVDRVIVLDRGRVVSPVGQISTLNTNQDTAVNPGKMWPGH